MRLFDSNVQHLKYRVLKELIRRAYDGGMENAYIEIPKIISPGPKSSMRCCVYKERAIVQERIKMGMNDSSNPNIIEVIDIACEECPIDGIYVTPACRGCLMHSCQYSCPKDAIAIIENRAVVDKAKCIECGKCTKACSYNAILMQSRPCVVNCKVNAITMDENKKAVIDNEKCISCGACAYKCPFGAITDKSLVLDIVDILKKSEDNTKYKVYAVVAPAIVSQCAYGRITQVVTAIKKLGFHKVVEAALGADITLYHEANEWKEKGVMTTSCCPSFVMYVEKNFPELEKYISHSVSPMVETALLIKRSDPTAKIVFIGPCSSKKMEYKLPKTKGAIDCVMSFEELQAFVDARGIDTTLMEDTPLEDASCYGRIFAKSGGITKGVLAVAETMGIEGVSPIVMSGISECKKALTKLKMGRSTDNFFEGMACEGGCVNGALCINHSNKSEFDVDKYGNKALAKTIDNSVRLYESGF